MYKREDIVYQLIHLFDFNQMQKQYNTFVQLVDLRSVLINAKLKEEADNTYSLELSFGRCFKAEVKSLFVFLTAAQILTPLGIASNSKTPSYLHTVMKQYITGWERPGSEQSEDSDLQTMKITISANVLELLPHLSKKVLDVADATGYTPLLYAIYRGNVEAVKILLDRGASMAVKTTSNQTAQELAAYRFNDMGSVEFQTIGKLLGECRIKRETEQLTKNKAEEERLEKEKAADAVIRTKTLDKLRTIIMEDDTREYFYYINWPVDVKLANDLTPLLYAAKLGRTKIVEDQLAHGARVDTRDNDYHTALMVAAINCNVETVAVLLKHMTPEQIKMTLHGKTAYELVQEAATKIGKMFKDQALPEYEQKLKKYEQIMAMLKPLCDTK